MAKGRRGLPLAYIRKWGISKLAWKKFRAGALTKGVRTRTAAIKRRLKGKNPKMARRRRYTRRRRRRGSMTIPIAPVAGLVAGLAAPIDYLIKGDTKNAMLKLCKNYTGYNYEVGLWSPDDLKRGLLPLVVGLLVHKFVGGPPLNLNRMLGRAKVPLIRI